MLTLNAVPSSWFGGVDESKIAAVGAAYPADPVVVCPKISLQTQEISDHANYPFQFQGSPFDTGDKYNLTYISPPPFSHRFFTNPQPLTARNTSALPLSREMLTSSHHADPCCKRYQRPRTFGHTVSSLIPLTLSLLITCPQYPKPPKPSPS